MDTVYIVICDDESVMSNHLQSLCLAWAKKEGHRLQTTLFESAESFLFAYEEDKSCDILLLDIQMKQMDGIALAKKVREKDKHIPIIFITGLTDYMAEGYEVEALHYLVKPVREEKLFEVLSRAMERRIKKDRMVLFKKSGSQICIPAKEIIYAEVLSHTITLHLTTGKEVFSMKLEEMEALLGTEFFRCHRSYLISLAFVRRVTRTGILLESGECIPVARNRYEEANQQFIRYHEGLLVE